MPYIKNQKVAIIGAGVAGCFLAILLAKRGFTINIYEQLSEKQIIDTASKKSFNLTFYAFALKALKKIGVWDALQSCVLPLKGSITQITKEATFITNQIDQKKLPYYTITRAHLLSALIKTAAKNPRIHIHFETPLVSIDRYKKTLLVQKRNIKKPSEIKCDIVFGADGINSLTRPYLQYRQEAQHTQQYCPWNYKQIIFPKDLSESLKLQKNFMHVWTRQRSTLIAYPQIDGSFATLLMLPNDDRTGYSTLKTPASIKKFITINYPHLLPALDIITDTILSSPEGRFTMVHTHPWYYKDFIALIGDSAHGFFPFFGQGISAAFGDCLALDRLVKKYGANWNKIFPLYEQIRKRHMDILGDLSQKAFESYIRSKKADYDAIYNRLENVLHNLFPKYIVSSLFLPIAQNPDRTGNYYDKHERQKRIAKLIGILLFVRLITILIAILETSTPFYNNALIKLNRVFNYKQNTNSHF